MIGIRQLKGKKRKLNDDRYAPPNFQVYAGE